MVDATALETRDLVVEGDRGELRLEAGTITVRKDAAVQARPTEVEVGVEQVRGATLEAPSRRQPGWLHVAVVGGSPPPVSGLAAAGDPYTLPLTSRGAGPARRFVKLVERHVRERGRPSEAADVRTSTGVVLDPDGPLSPRTPAPGASAEPDDDLVARLRELADLHAGGALSDDEFQRAKDRLLG